MLTMVYVLPCEEHHPQMLAEITYVPKYFCTLPATWAARTRQVELLFLVLYIIRNYQKQAYTDRGGL